MMAQPIHVDLGLIYYKRIFDFGLIEQKKLPKDRYNAIAKLSKVAIV